MTNLIIDVTVKLKSGAKVELTESQKQEATKTIEAILFKDLEVGTITTPQEPVKKEPVKKRYPFRRVKSYHFWSSEELDDLKSLEQEINNLPQGSDYRTIALKQFVRKHPRRTLVQLRSKLYRLAEKRKKLALGLLPLPVTTTTPEPIRPISDRPFTWN